MSISVLQAENVTPEQVDTNLLVFEGNGVRTQIREAISNFNASAIPVPPSANDILIPFMMGHVPQFVEITHQIEEALLKKSKASDADIRFLYNRRDEIIGEWVVTDDFKKFRSKCYAEHNVNIEKYNELQEIVLKLKPFLGMPNLPRIEVVSRAPAVLHEALKNAAGEEPLDGQMILRVDEPFHQKPMFWPKGIVNGRLNKALADKIAPVPYPLESVQARAAESKGAFLRRGTMCFPIENGVPVADGGWHSIDSLLPFALRSLCVPAAPMLMPDLAPDLRDMFDIKALEPIFHRTLAASNGLCMYCGSREDVTAVAFWRFREPIKGAAQLGVQILTNLWALCSECKNALRPSYNLLNQTREGSGQTYIAPSDDIMRRLILINHWMEDLAIENARTAYAMCVESQIRRNAFRWMVDISMLKSDYLVLKDNLEVGGSGWIDEVTEERRHSLFRIVGAGFLGPGKIRVFFSKPSIFDARWDDTMDSIVRRLHESDMTIIEKANKYDTLLEIKDLEANVSSKDYLPQREPPVDFGSFGDFPFDPSAADYDESEIALGVHLNDELLDEEDGSEEPMVSVPADYVGSDYDEEDEEPGSSGLRPVKH